VSGVDLVQWLTAQLDEDERIAKAATPGPWVDQGGYVTDVGPKVQVTDYGTQDGEPEEDKPQGRADSAHIARHDPARVLREIAADRELLAEYERLVRAHEAHQKEADRLNEAGDDDPFRTAALRREADYLPAMLHVLGGWAKRKAAVYRGRPGYRAEEWAP
jgi:hypothetical protein